MIKVLEKIKSVKGVLNLPGDKSLSHRAVMFSALAKGESKIYNCLESADVTSTINCFRQLGCEIEKSEKEIRVVGKGINGFSKPNADLDCGNSGTTARLISGVLAAQDFETRLIGDVSLSKRPMTRVTEPLSQMGAKFKTTDNGTLPMSIFPSNDFHAIDYTLPVASAQVKSAVLLAGLHNKEVTTVFENEATRNHTENLLKLDVVEKENGRLISVSSKNYPEPSIYNVPSDISSAAFFIVLALITENSELRLNNVLLNETRNGIVKILIKMGADISIENEKIENGEKTGDLIVRSSKLKNIEIEKDIIANIIDEIPVLSVAGIFAEGEFCIRNAKELRVKESDRIRSMVNNYNLLGLDTIEYDDGFSVSGKVLNDGCTIESYHDHRIAMAFGILSTVVEQEIKINGFESVEISNPKFIDQLKLIKE